MKDLGGVTPLQQKRVVMPLERMACDIKGPLVKSHVGNALVLAITDEVILVITS